MDNLQRSIEVRLSLWKIGVKRFGTFGVQIRAVRERDRSGHDPSRKRHHIFAIHFSGSRAWFTRFSLWSIFFDIERRARMAIRREPLFFYWFCYLCLFTMHSIRILLVIVALGLSNRSYLRPNKGPRLAHSKSRRTITYSPPVRLSYARRANFELGILPYGSSHGW